jgi:hypothetical protein
MAAIATFNGRNMKTIRRADATSFGPSSGGQDGRNETHAKREVAEEVAARLTQLDYLFPTQKRPQKRPQKRSSK